MRITRSIITVLTCIFILSGTVLFFFGEKKTWSENENRKLASFPSHDLESIESGRFTAGIEEYTKDHFPFRDEFMKVKTQTQLLCGYKEISGVYVGKDRLFQKTVKPDSERFEKAVVRLCGNIERKDVTVSLLLLPTASYFYPDELPAYAPTVDQEKIIADIDAACGNVKVPPVIQALQNAINEGNLYYRTDHHWTSFAALTACRAYCDSIGLSSAPISEYETKTLTETFRGTLYSRVLEDGIYDTVTLYKLPENTFTAYYADSATDIMDGNYTEYPYFSEKALEKKDKYTYFGGDNYPVVILKNENAATDREIVLAKDSFANVFAPFLTENFSTVYVLDQRYLKGKSVSDFVNENEKVTDVLILYGLNSLTDNSGAGMLS